MKKVWNNPCIEELTIQSTAWCNFGWGGRPGNRPGNGFGGGNGGSIGHGKCRCEGGISPCEKHHGFFPNDPEDETSSF